ncbi:type IV toxin-antitoxin system AbiEi family antitoxin [Microbacterium sp. BK668]|uniref:type IV toxin-antitoxin system AbiEi family antitoxin n=1 Tax=Microbacterium sp. BK668 TaxID=2512118 RepID=UPI00105B5638|nr:type IV toxin-antitoxin system AbiEi family antitoxin [Microbacterium sp. BK668]TDN92210.1 hypothetical protein EV279_1727 [Microbacterium sp. BK668]
MDDLLKALLQRAAAYDIEILDTGPLEQGESITLARVRRQTQSQEYLTLLSPHMQMPDSYTQARWTAHPLLVMGAKITPRNADRFRDLGINFIDANGNAYFEFGNVLVDVRGRSGDPLATEYQARPSMSNLFSPKRAQVIFALICWPDILNAKLRQIAQVAGVSVGFAQRTLADLEIANYIETGTGARGGRRLNDLDALIDGWVASFRGTIGSPDKTRAFRGDFDPRLVSDEGPDIYISGEAAADWLRGNKTWTLYCNEIPREAAAAGRWAARAGEPNIFVRPIFWNEPPSLDMKPRVRTAPPLLVYADLVTSNDSRQREAADYLRSEHADLRAQ